MKNTTSQPFVRLPLRLLHLQVEGLLKYYDLIVYCWTCALLHEKTGYWKAGTEFIPIAEISRRSRLARRTVSESLKRLSDFNVLDCTRGPGIPVLISADPNMGSGSPGPGLREPRSPLHEETSTKVDGEDARTRAHAALAPLRSLVLEIIRLNPNRTEHQLRELAENRFLESDLNHTINEFQSVWESLDWNNLG